jgi:serine/threonine protein kinase
VERLRQAAGWPDLTATKYEVIEELARGGMGTIYRARDRELEREVALKVPHEGSGQEARTLAQLEHPGIVPVHDVGTLPDGRRFYVMKLVRGRRLDQWAPGQPPAERLRLFEKICEAVAFAHAHGVIHLDLKPANIMVGEFGEVLVMDWGIARVAGREHRVTAGTPGYMAPEQERGEGGEASDVYALGAILRFLAGPEGPRPLRAVWERAMVETRQERYSNVQELAAEVARHLAGERVLAYRERPLERLGRVLAPHRTAVVLVLAYLFMRLLLLLFLGR